MNSAVTTNPIPERTKSLPAFYAMETRRQLAERLELCIFTYNRAPFLESTLTQLADSPFSLCKITVVDNASTDGTPLVVQRAAANLPKVGTIRHRANIGCSANYLRGVEQSQSLYTWVLCDDDSFDFAKIGDVVEKLLEGRIDLISVGVHTHNLVGGTLTTTRKLAMSQEYFLWHSFIAALIFKTAHFDSENLIEGYHNADTLLPHFMFNANMAMKDVSIYISKEKVITKGNNFGYAPLQFIVGWLRGCNKITDPELRRKALAEVLGGKNYWRNVIFAILIETTFRKKEVRKEYRNFLAEARRFTPWMLVKAYMLLPLVMAPKSVHKACWERYENYRRQQKQQEPPKFDADR